MSKAIANLSLHALKSLATKIAWHQWGAIGGSASTKASWQSIVDPEALILASLFLKESEPRITDVLFDWINLNSPLLSAQRLKNLQKSYPKGVETRLADVVSRIPSLAKLPRWKNFYKASDIIEAHTFPTVARAAKPMMKQTANLLLRLRTAMGVGVKADVLSVVLGNERPVTIRHVAETLTYTPVGVRNALDDLVSAGFVFETRGQPMSYRSGTERWQEFLGFNSRPHWTPWHHWFAFAIDYVTWADGLVVHPISEYAADVKIRNIVSNHEAFLRLAAHELGSGAFETEKGSSASSVNALINWGQSQLDLATL